MMTAYFEIDFLSVGERQSGDAIALRYGRDGNTFVHVVDGGFQDDGPHVMAHLRKYYGGRDVSHVVLTHPDSDHAGGLRSVLEECAVAPGGGLWMLRPWLYAAELLDHFARFTTVSGLENAAPGRDCAAPQDPYLRAFPGRKDRRVHGPRAVEGSVSPPDRGLREDTEGSCSRSQHGASQSTPICGSQGRSLRQGSLGGRGFLNRADKRGERDERRAVRHSVRYEDSAHR